MARKQYHKFKASNTLTPSTPVVVNGTTLSNFSMAKYTPADSADVVQGNAPYVKYGANNDFPDYLIRLYLSSPVHGPLTAGIAQMMAGKSFTTDAPISKADLRALCLDYIIHGGCYIQVYPSLDGSVIAKIEHLPFERCRLMREDEGEVVHGLYYSRDWGNLRAHPPVPLYKRKEDGQAESYVDWAFNATPGSMYYPKPSYISHINWIEASENISEFHVNNLLNGLFPSMIVTVVNAHATPEEKEEDRRELSKNQGAKSAGKWMLIHTDSPQNAPIFTPVPVTDADKQYQYLSEEATKQIFIGHRVTSPLLFGIRDSSGLGSNKDEMAEAMRIFMEKVIEPGREVITELIERYGFTLTFNDEIEVTAPAVDGGAPAANSQSLTKKDEDIWLKHLESRGERVDLDEWEVVNEQFVDTFEDDYSTVVKLSAEQKSKWGDSGLYKLRYRYSTNISTESRPFCKRMVELSEGGMLYRKEDIDIMSDAGVNGQFAPEGQTSYDIFRWKGGAYCHHKWVRVIFMRKRDKSGKILPPSKTSEMENDKRVRSNEYVPKKGNEGVRPIDTGSRGSLKYG